MKFKDRYSYNNFTNIVINNSISMMRRDLKLSTVIYNTNNEKYRFFTAGTLDLLINF